MSGSERWRAVRIFSYESKVLLIYFALLYFQTPTVVPPSELNCKLFFGQYIKEIKESYIYNESK